MRYKFIFLLVPILFIAACLQTGQQQAGEGITFDFLKNQPPIDNIYENQNFRVGLELKNYGPRDTRAYICVYDTVSDFFSGIPSNVCEQLTLTKAEKSGENIFPEVKQVYFPSSSQTYFYKSVTKGMTTNIITEVSYQYQTKATSQICIKKDASIETPNVPCDISSQEDLKQDPAPITVTNLRKDVFPLSNNQVQLLLTLDLQKQADGDVIDKKLLGASSFKQEDVETQLIDIGVNLRGITSKFECNPNRGGRIVFKENQKPIKCEATINLKEDYIVNPVEITLDYGFKTLKSAGLIPLISKEEAKGE